MVKVFVVYDSKYGNTKQVALKIVEELKEAGGFEVDVGYVKDVDVTAVAASDAVLLGAPNHMGKPSRTMLKFVDKLARAAPKVGAIAVFDTYFGRPRNFGKAMRKLEKLVGEKLSNAKLLLPGLSVKVVGISGPLADGELVKGLEFGKQIAGQLKS